MPMPTSPNSLCAQQIIPPNNKPNAAPLNAISAPSPKNIFLIKFDRAPIAESMEMSFFLSMASIINEKKILIDAIMINRVREINGLANRNRKGIPPSPANNSITAKGILELQFTFYNTIIQPMLVNEIFAYTFHSHNDICIAITQVSVVFNYFGNYINPINGFELIH